MLGAQLGRRSRVQNLLDRDSFCANNSLHFWTSEGKRPGLVDYDHIDPPKGFEVDTAGLK